MAPSSTPHRWRPSTARSARPPTPPPRAGIRINTIAPGLFDTPIYGTGEASEQFKEKLAANLLFPKRLGFSSEFASLAVEMITNSYFNAETVRLDAGTRMQPK